MARLAEAFHVVCAVLAAVSERNDVVSFGRGPCDGRILAKTLLAERISSQYEGSPAPMHRTVTTS
jgi:hypothetical protein